MTTTEYGIAIAAISGEAQGARSIAIAMGMRAILARAARRTSQADPGICGRIT